MDLAARDVKAQSPEELTGLRLTPPEQVAAGLPAVLSTLRYAAVEPGLVRGARLLARLNQKNGFDCSSCAWPDPDEERSLAEFCENGARAAADEGTSKRAAPEFFARWSVEELSRRSDHWLNKQGRITHPMILEPGSRHYRPIAWDEAFSRIAECLRGLESPHRAVFYTSGRTSNEAAFLYQLFVRQLGTNNLPDCSNMCHESSGVALAETIGTGKGTIKLEDVYKAQAIFVIGQNPGTNHPRMLTALEAARRKGARIVSINPLPEAALVRFKNPQDFLHPLKALRTLAGPGSPIADLHLPVRINGDVAVLKGILKELLEMEESRPGSVFDRAFRESRTEGFEPFLTDLRAESWDRIVESGGVSRDKIRRAAEIAAGAERIVCCWAMGLTQHPNAVANIQEIVNLLLVRGAFGKPGAGACPVRGHSNVQGDRTMGIHDKPSGEFLDALAAEFGFDPPREPGLDTVEAIRAMHQGRVDVFFAMGGNFLSATPDTELTAEALRRCRLTVQVSIKPNRSHLVTGEEAIILPCLGRSERDLQPGGLQFVSCENSMGVVQKSQGNLPPASPSLKSEPAIVAELALATLGPHSSVPWRELAADYDRIRERVARVVPGFVDYNRRVREPGGFYLPNGPREGRFPTSSGRARFTIHPIPPERLGPGELLMMTVRTHDQFNTTIYGLDDRYRGIHNERRVVLLHPGDIREAGLAEGAVVDLVSRHGGRERVARKFVVVEYPIPRGCAATYFPEANVLVPIDSVAEKSNTPASKSVVIRLRVHGVE
ncbi:MAG: FdhF/YdeP family oxidoreductase [Armatimonadetes bacterium]|nr:FdhF/YdeP family oxidoreductase [Armatimonadota bacterium]